MTLNIDRLLRTARSEIKAGRPAVARTEILQALEQFPNNTKLLAQLADVQQAATGLPARPFAAPHLHHFLAVKTNVGLPIAIEEMAAAVRLNPANPWAQGVLGGVLMEAKLLPAAIRHFRAALKLDPNYREAGLNLGNALRQANEPAQALTALEDVLRRTPDFPAALLMRGQILAQLQRDREAADTFARYLALQPRDAEAMIDYAAALIMLHRLDDARATLLRVLDLQPNNPRAMGTLGNILLSNGDIDGARAQFLAALAINPNSAVSFFNLGRAMDFTADDPLIARMQALAADPGLQIDEQVALHFGLAKAFEDIGDADASFAHLQRGNDLRASQIRYTIEQDRTALADLLHRFAAASPALQAAPTPRRPVFVLGMMRSGTTLMEQILSSHPMVYGAGELEPLPELAAIEMAQTKGPLDQAALLRIRNGYLSVINAQPGAASVVVDKLPANFRLIGLIRKALPEARILHMQRDPVAVCWSIYKTFFTNLGIGYANSLTDTISYYDLYTDMMRQWRAEYPDGFMDVDYEQLTRDPEPAIRAALAYCDLPFDPACLSPQDNQRSVRTASVRQVRSGIYQGSSKKWRAFEPHLAPLIAHFSTAKG